MGKNHKKSLSISDRYFLSVSLQLFMPGFAVSIQKAEKIVKP